MLNSWNSYQRLCFKNFPQPWSKLVETKFENLVNSRNDSIFQFANSLPHPPKSMLNLAKFFFWKPKTFQKTFGDFGEEGFFTEKEIFYFVATDLSKIVGYGHSCKKYVFDICFYRTRLDFAFYYFLTLKFIENLHKL